MAPMKQQRHESTAERLGALSVPQVARRWHTTRHRVRRLLQTGRLPFEQINGEIRVPLAAVCGREERQASGRTVRESAEPAAL